jgi:F-type H+-transporting ATPase subunit b
MQIDWTTFFLEILNFLVLVWILKRFFYKPVLGILERRRAAVSAESEAAGRAKAEAEALKSDYESRLAEWERERTALHLKLNGEIAGERSRQLAALQESLAAEAEATRARARTETAEKEAACRVAARSEAFGAASAMLRRIASPALTGEILDAAIEDLRALDQADRTRLQQSLADLSPGDCVDVASAHPLESHQRARLKDALTAAIGAVPDIAFREDSSLIAGVRVAIGEYMLSADLAGELASFRTRDAGHG